MQPILDLGQQPLANSLIEDSDHPFHTYPLGLSVCPSCTHGQLTHFVDPKEIFVDYLYASGTSQTLKDFFSWFAGKIVASLGTDIEVLELASNDGSLLDALRQQGLNPTGIDPAENLCEVASKNGHSVKCGFFPVVRPDAPVDVIVAMNVAAHTPDPSNFAQGIYDCLRPGGVALIQTSQANMIANGEFDTIYHEHYSFYTAKSMSTLARSVGLELERVELVSVHGNSFLFTLRKPGGNPRKIDFSDTDQKGFYVALPDPLPPLFNPNCPEGTASDIYERFAAAAEEKMYATSKLLDEHVADGKFLGLVGVAAKALTFVHAAGLKPRYFFDEASLKIGRFVPGSQTPILPLSALESIDQDVVLLIGAWNFAPELAEKIGENIRGTAMEHRVTLIVHQPELGIL